MILLVLLSFYYVARINALQMSLLGFLSLHSDLRLFFLLSLFMYPLNSLKWDLKCTALWHANRMCELTLSVHGNIRIMTHIQLSIQPFREALNNRSVSTEWPWKALFLLTSKRGKSAEPARLLCHGNNHLLCCRFSLFARKYSALGTIGLRTHTCFIYGVHAARLHCETPQAYVNKHPGFHPLLKMYYFLKRGFYPIKTKPCWPNWSGQWLVLCRIVSVRWFVG